MQSHGMKFAETLARVNKRGGNCMAMINGDVSHGL
jgi:hypothetical protein